MEHKESLLGLNELHIMEFNIAGRYFGIEVTKIGELVPMQYHTIQEMADAKAYVEGMVRIRDQSYTVLDFAGYMEAPTSETPERDILITLDCHQKKVALHVHNVDGIQQLSRDMVEDPQPLVPGRNCKGIVEGLAKIADRITVLINPDKIVQDISSPQE